METCDVLVVGGGPAGSTCAGKLRAAGLDVMLMDKATFPRQKPCAGWITPEVLEALDLDADEYGQSRVLQAISGFRTGLINRSSVVTRFGATVSYGIRRSEFDQYLLERSGVRRQLGEAVTTARFENGWWLVNGRLRTRMLVGAGGHFCPVAGLLGAKIGREDVVVAQAAEFVLSPDEERSCSVQPDTPALYFCRDLKGYGWLFRKGNYLNVGLGRLGKCNLAGYTGDFCTFIRKQGALPSGFDGMFQGHVYRLYREEERRNCVGSGVLLIGDSAGLAYPHSGEGILPAIESGLIAAETILAAKGDYRRDNLEPYAGRLERHFGGIASWISSMSALSRFSRFLGPRLLSSKWCARHIVLDHCFLHTTRKNLS